MATEQFREWNPKNGIKVTYKAADGSTKKWEANQEALLSTILGVTDAYMKKGIKLTNRQLYYRLVATNTIPNALKIYKRICDFLTDARYGGYIDWQAIEDRGRKPDMHAQWDDVKALIESAVSAYRKPRWDGQEYYVELMCEKQALESVFQPVSNKYHIYFGYNKGYSSASTMYDMAKRVKEAIEEGKHAIVFYWGDFDASGLDMRRDIKDRTVEFLTQGEQPLDDLTVYDMFDLIPLGLNMEQIERYHPPPNPAKALALNTPLPTPMGWTTIKDITIGDMLFSDDGSICRVVEKSPVFQNKDCYKFTFSCGETIISSKDHLWVVDGRKRSKDNGIKTTLQIASGWSEGKDERPIYRIPIAKPLKLPYANLLIPPYTLGAWLGDGFSEGYCIACSERDTEILNYIEEDGFKVKRYNNKITCGISGLCKYLTTEGLLKNKHIPIQYLRSSYNQRLRLLQGLMDTDGTVSNPSYRTKIIQSPSCSFSSSRKHLAEQVLELLVSLGIRGNLSESRAICKSKDCGATWRVEFYPGDIDVFRLKRKRERLNDSTVNIRQNWRTIIKVEKVRTIPTQCLIVDSKSHLFLAGKQMIPTHNSTDPRAAGYIKEHGNISWELDAVDPTDLREMTETAILEYLDVEMYNTIVAEEKEEIKKLREFGESIVNGGDDPEEKEIGSDDEQ